MRAKAIRESIRLMVVVKEKRKKDGDIKTQRAQERSKNCRERKDTHKKVGRV